MSSVADVLAGRAQWAVECTDVLDGLRRLQDGCVQTVVTSVPYYGLRDYGTATWDGGDPACTHEVRPAGSGLATSGLQGGRQTVGHQREGYRGSCGRCGAVRIDQQIGLEETPAEYLTKMVAVFGEVRRVLRGDGTVWLNCGDAYGSGTRATRDYSKTTKHGYWNNPGINQRIASPAKQLLGMPWRLAFALQDAGWYLRCDIIWSKPNPMPESVTDRPTKAHEYLFLLSKSARYFFDAEAIRESDPEAGRPWGEERRARQKVEDVNGYGQGRLGSTSALRQGRGYLSGSRNKRSVWTIPTEPYSEAHFATFPTALVEPCILAGCPVDGTVLDPFAGSGTTLLVALRHDRRAIGLELSPTYCEMARRRIIGDAPMFNAPAVGEAAG